MKKIYPYLTYAGALPFIICAFLINADIEALGFLGETKHILAVYGLVIATFMAGSHWGQHLSLQKPWDLYLPVSSNVITVLLWVIFLVTSFDVFLLALVVTFILQLVIDFYLYRDDVIDCDYFKTRLVTTTVVVLSLCISWISTIKG